MGKGTNAGKNAGKNAGSSTMKATRAAYTRGSAKAGPGPLTSAISAAANANAKTARKQSDQAAKSSKERAAGKQI